MIRRDFIKGIFAALACAAIPAAMKKPTCKYEAIPESELSPYEALLRANAMRHMEEMERAFLFGMDAIETPLGTAHFKRHPLFS